MRANKKFWYFLYINLFLRVKNYKTYIPLKLLSLGGNTLFPALFSLQEDPLEVFFHNALQLHKWLFYNLQTFLISWAFPLFGIKSVEEQLPSQFSCKNREWGGNNARSYRGATSILSCPHLCPLLSPSFTEVSQGFKRKEVIHLNHMIVVSWNYWASWTRIICSWCLASFEPFRPFMTLWAT